MTTKRRDRAARIIQEHKLKFEGSYTTAIALHEAGLFEGVDPKRLEQRERQIERLQKEVQSYAKSYPSDKPCVFLQPGDLDPIKGEKGDH